jgi:hypothetical protein
VLLRPCHDVKAVTSFAAFEHAIGQAVEMGAPGSSGYPVPAAKGLFGKANERGLPIGNLTSQFWATCT